MNCAIRFQEVFQIDRKKWLMVVGLVAMTHILCQSLMLPYGSALLSLLPTDHSTAREEFKLKSEQSYTTKEALLLNGMKIENGIEVGGNANEMANNMDIAKEINSVSATISIDTGVDFVEDANLDNDMPFEEVTDANEIDPPGSNLAKGGETRHSLSIEQVVKPSNHILADEITSPNVKTENVTILASSIIPITVSSPEELPTNGKHVLVQNDFSSLNSTVKKKMKCEMPPTKITLIHEMEQLLVRHRARSRAMVEILILLSDLFI